MKDEKEDLPLTPSPRPADPFTAIDGMRLYEMINTNMKKISSTWEDISNRLAIAQKNDLKILEILEIIENGLTTSRMGRLELEIQETERERDLAEKALAAVNEKLNSKQSAKDQTLSTDEKINVKVKDAYTDIEKTKRQKREEWLEDLRRSAIKTALNIAVGGVLTFVFGLIWFLIQLYLNRPGP